MKNKILGAVMCILTIVSLALTACTPEATTSTPAASTPTHTAGMDWWSKFGEPQYGGTILSRDIELLTAFDPAEFMGGQLGCYEALFYRDWTVDREICDFTVDFVDVQYYKGGLAESWEQTDPLTYTVHIQPGVYWQDKEPVNGRELTAEDVQYTYDRILGTGSGFTQPNMFYSSNLSNVERVVATDTYTVEFQMKSQGALGIYDVFDGGFLPIVIVAPEWVELYGSAGMSGPPPGEGGPPDGGGGPPPGESAAGGPPGGESEGGPPAAAPTNWETVVGTGPWLLTDYASGVSMTYSKNPNYWGFDERYPENRLPYVDALEIVVIPDHTTALAALRSGRIDVLETPGSYSWLQAQSLADTHPDIQVAWYYGSNSSVEMRVDRAPFTDIRVRQALQLAIDREQIAASYFGGAVDGTPCGLVCPLYEGWTIPYDEWPAELQAQYSYNPDKAKELLAKAAQDGVFEVNEYGGFDTNAVAEPQGGDIELLEIIKAQFMEIGVDMEIQTLADMATLRDFCMNGNHEQMVLSNNTSMGQQPSQVLLRRTATRDRENYTYSNDPEYESLVDQVYAATTIEEAKQLSTKADLYALEQHWAVTTFSGIEPVFWHPWIKGNSGEKVMGMIPFYCARWWIDKDLKASMGY